MSHHALVSLDHLERHFPIVDDLGHIVGCRGCTWQLDPDQPNQWLRWLEHLPKEVIPGELALTSEDKAWMREIQNAFQG
jgi:hypothetical protein